MLTPYLDTIDYQFGLKKGHPTDHCMFKKNCIRVAGGASEDNNNSRF